jgi:hypothetical protein
MKRPTVRIKDGMHHGYTYNLVAPSGRNFAPEFTPELTPAEMLRLGIFDGKYMTDCMDDFPASWFRSAKLSPERPDPSLNQLLWLRREPADPCGGRRAGSTRRNRAAGSSGTAAIISGAAWTTTRGRSGAGASCAATCARSSVRASAAIASAGPANGRSSCSGPSALTARR